MLEEFVSTEFEGTLEEVAGEGWANTRQQGTSTFIRNDLSEATDQTAVVCDRVELNSCLDAEGRVSAGWRVNKGRDLHVDGSEATVGD